MGVQSFRKMRESTEKAEAHAMELFKHIQPRTCDEPEPQCFSADSRSTHTNNSPAPQRVHGQGLNMQPHL